MRPRLKETMLHYVLTGTKTDKPPLLIAHGLFGSARNWRAIAKRLSEDRQVITVDMRNHGESPRAPTQSYPEMAEDLAAVIDKAAGRADVLGHSMGGKAAMVLALQHPEKVRKLIVADIAPVAYDHSHSGLIEAMQSLDLKSLATRSEADKALAERIKEPMIRAFLLQSLDMKDKKWRINLDALAREMPEISGFPEIHGVFPGPTLFLSGGNSDYVLPQYRDQMKRLFPKAVFARIPGTGHWLHAEKPVEFTDTVRSFLDG